MSAEIRLLEGLSGPAGPTTDVVAFPFREVRSQIAQGKDVCEKLREYIGAIRQLLSALEGDIGKVDAREVREAFQLQLASMNEMLQHGLAQLSRTEELLEDTLRRTHCHSGEEREEVARTRIGKAGRG